MSKRNERILLLGLGGVGFHLARRLTHDGHALTIIESRRELIQRADGEVDARLVRGNAMSFTSWEEADAEKMDYLIAVTDNDAVNILSSVIADRCGIGHKIARVRSLELWDRGGILSKEDLAVDFVIRPEELAAQEVARLLRMRASVVTTDIANSTMQVMGTRITEYSPLAHRNLKDLSVAYDEFYFRVVSIARGITTIIPGGDDEILPGDHIHILANSEDLPKLMKLAGVKQERRHHAMIIGGGLIGSRVAELLEGEISVRIVEADRARAEELSYELKKTEILHGDGSDTGTLLKAGLQDMETIITATGDNETNIMTGVLAKHLQRVRGGASAGQEVRTITLVKREKYLVLAGSMGSDIVLNKKVLAANEILKYIRRGKVLSVDHLHGSEAEVVELVAETGAAITRKPLYQCTGMQDGIIIGGVRHEGTWEIAVGDTHVQPGDTVIGICTSDHLRELQSLILS